MESKRLYIILFLFLALTVLVEGLKHFNKSTANLDADRMNLAWSDVGVKPFAVHYDETPPTMVKKSKGLRGGFRLAGKPVGDLKTYDFSEGHIVAEKKVEDKKAKDKDKKKKARKKKKKSEEKTMVAKNSDAPLYDESTKTKKSGFGLDENSGFAPGFAQPPPPENTEPKTYEDWAKLILGSPNPDNVKRMVESYRSRQIGSDVFYGILQAMMNESNSTQHELAVYAAGNVLEANSFIFLVDALKTTENTNALTGQIADYLNYYRTPRNIAIMRPVISQRMEDAETVNMAVQMISRSTTQYLALRTPSAASLIDTNFPVPANGVPGVDPNATDTAGEGRSGQAADPKSYYKFYAHLESILEQVAAKYQNDIGESATKSLERIRAAKPLPENPATGSTALASEAFPQ